MKLLCFIALFGFASCSPQYLDIKRLVQKNCDRNIDIDNIRITKRGTYYIANILRDSIYTNVHYFIIYGHNWDDVIMAADDKKIYWMNDSFCNKILLVNSQLTIKGIEIGEIYINGADSFSVRTRTVEKKYLYKVVDVQKIEELLSVTFEYAASNKKLE